MKLDPFWSMYTLWQPKWLSITIIMTFRFQPFLGYHHFWLPQIFLFSTFLVTTNFFVNTFFNCHKVFITKVLVATCFGHQIFLLTRFYCHLFWSPLFFVANIIFFNHQFFCCYIIIIDYIFVIDNMGFNVHQISY